MGKRDWPHDVRGRIWAHRGDRKGLIILQEKIIPWEERQKYGTARAFFYTIGWIFARPHKIFYHVKPNIPLKEVLLFLVWGCIFFYFCWNFFFFIGMIVGWAELGWVNAAPGKIRQFAQFFGYGLASPLLYGIPLLGMALVTYLPLKLLSRSAIFANWLRVLVYLIPLNLLAKYVWTLPFNWVYMAVYLWFACRVGFKLSIPKTLIQLSCYVAAAWGAAIAGQWLKGVLK